MEFKKYQHIERFGTDEVQGIELGKCHIFPKVDGTNANIWHNSISGIMGGSRNRELTLDNDNQGFYRYLLDDARIVDFYKTHRYRLFGEWLVPHSLKTYKTDAWRKFYIFDVCKEVGDGLEYVNYDIYKPLLDEYELDYIPCIATIKNGSYEQFINWLQHNNYLIEDGKGTGEGIVIKNYDFYNQYGRQTWAKIVTSEFKEKHAKVMGAPDCNGKAIIEEEIAEKYCTIAMIEKTFEKIKNDNDGWKSRYIPELLNRVYNDIIVEEIWNIIKEYKKPVINFKTLHYFIVGKVKEIKTELF